MNASPGVDDTGGAVIPKSPYFKKLRADDDVLQQVKLGQP
mgnify:FL=1|jgi:hypothetical protein